MDRRSKGVEARWGGGGKGGITVITRPHTPLSITLFAHTQPTAYSAGGKLFYNPVALLTRHRFLHSPNAASSSFRIQPPETHTHILSIYLSLLEYNMPTARGFHHRGKASILSHPNESECLALVHIYMKASPVRDNEPAYHVAEPTKRGRRTRAGITFPYP